MKFKTRARAVDMLGRQQIAGIPTAISELFKNAHDAYANTVRADYFRPTRLFVLRDDGIGMSLDDFENRWLVLGTDSKLKQSVLRFPPPGLDKPPRRLLGEKGIGRLAIGAIGPQVLVLTRSYGERDQMGVVAGFVNWTMFQLPGIDVSEIEIPVSTFSSLPDRADIANMVDAVRRNLEALHDRTDQEIAELVLRQLNDFDVDPVALAAQLGNPTLTSKGSGTQFYIQPVDETLALDIDREAADKASPLKKMLLGFTNTMMPDAHPPLVAEFHDHKTWGADEELISHSEFFTPEEFRSADHHIQGEFDAFGRFSGTITVYGGTPMPHMLNWPAGRQQQTECGPFRLSVAVVQGAARDSRLPPEEWAMINQKMSLIGGLYVYKDGVRVLPYGNTDYDFLDIEFNRTKGAAYYYFSHRRIFGAIQIDQERNPKLTEKAGREGFRENTAYRQFRDILKNFFVQVAADFFREGGDDADLFHQGKSELNRKDRARRQREKTQRGKRERFQKILDVVLRQLEAGDPAREVSLLVQAVERELKPLPPGSELVDYLQELHQTKARAGSQLRALRERYRVTAPAGVGLTQQLRRDWEAYRTEVARLNSTVFGPAALEIEELIAQYGQGLEEKLDRKLRIEAAISEAVQAARSRIRLREKGLRQVAKGAPRRITGLIREAAAYADGMMNKITDEANRLPVLEMSEASFVESRVRLENRVSEAVDEVERLLNSLAEQLDAIAWTRDEEGGIITSLDAAEAAEEELLALKDQTETDLELTQLGMAIEVINHEFEASIKAVRGNLSRLKAWADLNKSLQPLYGNMRASFDHLDGYLTLFTPLHRRLYRKEVEIRGADIGKFLEDLFRERLARDGVQLTATPAFLRFVVSGYPSTFYPIFVNLMDNALFWLRDQAQPREIMLDSDSKGFLLSDNGPGVALRDREVIFERGFTRKPYGRGLGLYISQEILARVGYEITLEREGPLKGATFRIGRREGKDS